MRRRDGVPQNGSRRFESGSYRLAVEPSPTFRWYVGGMLSPHPGQRTLAFAIYNNWQIVGKPHRVTKVELALARHIRAHVLGLGHRAGRLLVPQVA